MNYRKYRELTADGMVFHLRLGEKSLALLRSAADKCKISVGNFVRCSARKEANWRPLPVVADKDLNLYYGENLTEVLSVRRFPYPVDEINADALRLRALTDALIELDRPAKIRPVIANQEYLVEEVK